MKIESVSLDRCKSLGCRALHQTIKGNHWCAAKLMGEPECIHPDNREQEVKNAYTTR